MDQPATILENGTAVRTNTQLEIPQSMIAMPSLIANRRPDSQGMITGVVPGHGGDVYWVKHEDDKVAPYSFSEFELVP